MRTVSNAGPWVRKQTLGVVLAATLLGACGVGLPDGERRGAGSVTGVVAAAKTAEGIPDLVVVLTREGRVLQVAHTSDEGAFRFDGLEPGRYRVAVIGLEFSDLSPLRTVFTPTEQRVVVGAEPVDLTFAAVGLVPARIVGEITCGGRPAVGARIRVVGGSTATVVQTDVVGRYGATDLAPGNYTVMAVEVPCDVGSWVEVVSVNTGQSVDVDFEGE